MPLTPNPGDPNLLALSDAARAMKDAAELLTKRCDAMEREDISKEELGEFEAQGSATGYPDAEKDKSTNEQRASAIQSQINKDKRIKSGEGRKIQALLKGWRGNYE